MRHCSPAASYIGVFPGAQLCKATTRTLHTPRICCSADGEQGLAKLAAALETYSAIAVISQNPGDSPTHLPAAGARVQLPGIKGSACNGRRPMARSPQLLPFLPPGGPLPFVTRRRASPRSCPGRGLPARAPHLRRSAPRPGRRPPGAPPPLSPAPARPCRRRRPRRRSAPARWAAHLHGARPRCVPWVAGRGRVVGRDCFTRARNPGSQVTSSAVRHLCCPR